MNKSIGLVILNFAVAIYLFATGILGLVGGKHGSEIHSAVNALFRGGLANALIVVLAILAIAAGIFILLRFFGIAAIPATELLLIILAITWVVFIIMIDIVLPLNSKGGNFVLWLRSIGAHLMALAGILLATERFGGR
jgi:hypothetical protein